MEVVKQHRWRAADASVSVDVHSRTVVWGGGGDYFSRSSAIVGGGKGLGLSRRHKRQVWHSFDSAEGEKESE